METSSSHEVADLLATYEHHVQHRDFRRLARLYESSLAVAGPNSVVFHRNNIFTRWMFDKGMKKHYETTGVANMVIKGFSEHRVTDHYLLAAVKWTATYLKRPDQPIDFTVTYMLRRTKRKLRIVMSIAHDDETKVLQGYGII